MDNDVKAVPGYQIKTNVCGNCDMAIEQWEPRPEAGYRHIHSKRFTCDDKFQPSKVCAYCKFDEGESA